VRHVRVAEQALLRDLRLASLATDPDAFGSTYARDAARPAEWWEQWAVESETGTSQRTFVLLADDDRWLGLALVRLDDERPGSAMLYGMWVAPEVRGRRGAGVLCDACATWAAEHGCAELTLEVVVDNDAARRAYEAASFIITGNATWSHDGRTLDEFVMMRAL
jgi:RimJ/RimL family protein N-acetyltransferase